jgi:UDP-glucose-4-epimerase GalE
MSAVLVTGGAGYIGSHAVKALVRAGRRVVVYDDLSAGHREAAVIAGAGVATLIEGDIRDTARVAAVLEEHAIESVMHFAAWLSVGDSVHNPAGYYQNNVTGALSVLQAMVTQGVRQLVFSSTCAVFGNPVTTPIDEDHPRKPINAYGETKLTIEYALPHYERAYGLRSIALRYFNAAGADPDGELGEDHEPEIHVIPRAIDAACGRGHFQIFGASAGARGARTRSVVHRLQPRDRPADFGPRNPGGSRTSDRMRCAPHHRSASRRRSRDSLCCQCTNPARTRLGAAVRGPRCDRRNRIPMAAAASARLCKQVMA